MLEECREGVTSTYSCFGRKKDELKMMLLQPCGTTYLFGDVYCKDDNSNIEVTHNFFCRVDKWCQTNGGDNSRGLPQQAL